ncbi:MAG: family 78 glycoside hydrolase catalytic domain, partial [Fimbriimonadaceae bacterium]|nr:family 78 glycoside hydrolase catalytic domain [Fimbriimonadaceae bacterium]
MEDPRPGARPTAYRITAGPTPDCLGRLDTGRIESDDVWSRPLELGCMERLWWRVKLWDHHGEESDWSEPAVLEAARFDGWDSADWVHGGEVGAPEESAPAPILTLNFEAGEVQRARLDVVVLGAGEFSLDGRRLPFGRLTGGWSEFSVRARSRSLDLADLIGPGRHSLEVELGDGWFCGRLGWMERGKYGDRPRLKAFLTLWNADGSVTELATGGDWTWRSGPTRRNDRHDGEEFDARPAAIGESRPVLIGGPEGLIISPHQGPEVVPQEVLRPIAPPVKKGDGWIFDFGQNLVGVVRMRLAGAAGQTLELRHAEVLDDDGGLYLANLRKAKCIDRFTFAGTGEPEEWEPMFTYHGFRYLEVKGLTEALPADAFTAVVLNSELELSGGFRCSDDRVNRLVQNAWWSMKGNFLEVPTDCPQRDERLGWTGDAQVFIPAAAVFADVEPFFRKWAEDMRDGQEPSGAINCVVPTMPIVPGDGGPAWSDAQVICTWELWRRFGDLEPVREHLDSMRRWMEHVHSPDQTRDGIRPHPEVPWRGFGDWLSTNAET